MMPTSIEREAMTLLLGGIIFIIFFFFLATLHGLWDLSSLIQGWNPYLLQFKC